jgi:hypothetical protein
MTMAVTRAALFVLPVSARGMTGPPSSLMRSVGDETTEPEGVSISSDTSVYPRA